MIGKNIKIHGNPIGLAGHFYHGELDHPPLSRIPASHHASNQSLVDFASVNFIQQKKSTWVFRVLKKTQV